MYAAVTTAVLIWLLFGVIDAMGGFKNFLTALLMLAIFSFVALMAGALIVGLFTL